MLHACQHHLQPVTISYSTAGCQSTVKVLEMHTYLSDKVVQTLADKSPDPRPPGLRNPTTKANTKLKDPRGHLGTLKLTKKILGFTKLPTACHERRCRYARAGNAGIPPRRWSWVAPPRIMTFSDALGPQYRQHIQTSSITYKCSRWTPLVPTGYNIIVVLYPIPAFTRGRTTDPYGVLTPVAPLDFSTSLIGSRDPVVIVSASVDSLAWRNAIALTNESTRSKELKSEIHRWWHTIVCVYIMEACHMSAWAVASRCCNITVHTSTTGRIILFYPCYSYFCYAATNARLVNRKHKRRGKIKCQTNEQTTQNSAGAFPFCSVWLLFLNYVGHSRMYTFGYPHGWIINNAYTGETCECRKPMLMWYECTGLVAVSSVCSLCAQSAVLLNGTWRCLTFSPLLKSNIVSSAAIKLTISVLIASNWTAVPWPWKAWDDGRCKLKWTESIWPNQLP